MACDCARNAICGPKTSTRPRPTGASTTATPSASCSWPRAHPLRSGAPTNRATGVAASPRQSKHRAVIEEHVHFGLEPEPQRRAVIHVHPQNRSGNRQPDRRSSSKFDPLHWNAKRRRDARGLSHHDDRFRLASDESAERRDAAVRRTAHPSGCRIATECRAAFDRRAAAPPRREGSVRCISRRDRRGRCSARTPARYGNSYRSSSHRIQPLLAAPPYRSQRPMRAGRNRSAGPAGAAVAALTDTPSSRAARARMSRAASPGRT